MILLKCLKNGNIGIYDKVLEENEEEFISTGVYLIFERLRYIVYRNLFMNTLKIVKNPQQPLSVFLKSLEVAGEVNPDLDQLECILANLISKVFIYLLIKCNRNLSKLILHIRRVFWCLEQQMHFLDLKKAIYQNYNYYFVNYFFSF